MNSKHMNFIASSVKAWCTGPRKRIKHYFGVSEVQRLMLERVEKVRELVDSIPDDIPLYIYGYCFNLAYLFRFTNIKNKNIVGIITDEDTSVFYDCYDNDREYRIYRTDSAEVKEANHVLMAEIDKNGSHISELIKNGFQGKSFSLYDENDTMPFFCIRRYDEQAENANVFAQRVAAQTPTVISEYYLDAVRRIDKINNKISHCKDKKVIVYCAGGHTYELLRLTDVRYMDVIAIADRDVREFCGIATRDTSAESFMDADYIIISSYVYQSEIKKYLEKIGFGDKVICLYDEEDEFEFYYNKNTFSPDFPYRGEMADKLSIDDVYAIAESCMQELSHCSDCYLTYSIIDNNMLLKDKYYRGEEEFWKAKGYEKDNKKVAIVVQGPIVYDEDFTYNSIRLYKRIYPGAAIILSTWETEQNNEKFKDFYDLGINIKLSSLPEKRGFVSMNFQVKSSLEGVKMAETLGFEYVIKTRTDFRLHAEGVLSYIYNLTKRYPTEDGRERLTVLQPMLDYPAYMVPDFIVFGNVRDMKNLWDDTPYPEESDGRNPEVHIYERYFKRINKYIENAQEKVEEYIDLLCKELIIVDPEIYGYIWKKYSYEGIMTFTEKRNILTSIDWFNRQKQ